MQVVPGQVVLDPKDLDYLYAIRQRELRLMGHLMHASEGRNLCLGCQHDSCGLGILVTTCCPHAAAFGFENARDIRVGFPKTEAPYLLLLPQLGCQLLYLRSGFLHASQ